MLRKLSSWNLSLCLLEDLFSSSSDERLSGTVADAEEPVSMKSFSVPSGISHLWRETLRYRCWGTCPHEIFLNAFSKTFSLAALTIDSLLQMPRNLSSSAFMRPFVVLALPGMYLFYKYSQYKRQQQEQNRRKVTERELAHLNHKIVSLTYNTCTV